MKKNSEFHKDRKTVGQISLDLAQKEPDTRSSMELEQEAHKDYEKHIEEAIQRGRKELLEDDFFVVVITKKERLMQNVIRQYFTCRVTCPTPNYDQVVYKYTKSDDSFRFIWVIPDRGTCWILLDNKEQVHPDDYPVLGFVMSFADGSLMRLCQELNNEQVGSLLLNPS